jgi:hypothetical protein
MRPLCGKTRSSGSLLRRVWWGGGILGILIVACASPAPVVQGKIVESDAQGTRLAVQDETRPDAPPVVLDISAAEVGSRPVAGDRVRVVYRVVGDTNRALAVMNLGGRRESATSR